MKASLQIYGKKTQEDLKRKMEAEACKRARCLSCLSGVLDDAVCPADIKLPPKGRKGGAMVNYLTELLAFYRWLETRR